MRRRELLTRGGIGGFAMLAGAGALLGSQAAGAVQAPSDATILAQLIQLHQVAVLACRRVLASHELSRAAGREVRQVLTHQRTHAAALSRELASLGAQPPAAPTDIAAADALLASHNVGSRVSSVRSEDEGLQLLLDIELLLTGTYFDAISKLQSASLAQRSAEIMASEAQHKAVLAALMAPGDFVKIAPTAFVQGTH